jgi:hypothetical protein
MPLQRSIAIAGVFLIVLACGGGPTGCAAGASSQTITAAYADALETMTPGTELAQFKKRLSAARHIDTQFTSGQRIDTYRLTHRYKPDELEAQEQVLYFFFSDDKLIRWGSAPW